VEGTGKTFSGQKDKLEFLRGYEILKSVKRKFGGLLNTAETGGQNLTFRLFLTGSTKEKFSKGFFLLFYNPLRTMSVGRGSERSKDHDEKKRNLHIRLMSRE